MIRTELWRAAPTSFAPNPPTMVLTFAMLPGARTWFLVEMHPLEDE